MGDFLMPSLGADMDVGTILEWRVHPGEVVHRGDIVAVVDTDKSDIEVEVFEDGVVEELLVEVGQEVAVGTPLARLAPLGAGAPTLAGPAMKPATAARRPAKPATRPAAKRAGKPAKAAAAKASAAAARPGQAPKRPTTVLPGAGQRASGAPQQVERVRSSPLARRLAVERGLDLRELHGSGEGGAVVAADLVAPAAPDTGRFPAGAVPTEAPAERRSMAERQLAMRQAIAELMARSKREIPHYYLATTIDLAAASAWLTAENARRTVAERLLPAALLLKATALAAREVPALNGFWDGAFQPAPGVHLGVAVSLRGGGLLAPAIHDTDRLAIDDLMRALRDLVDRARSGRLRASEMSDPTLTVTNLGEQGAEEVYGVIYPPQVAIVGFGKITERPWASAGMLGVHPTVRATLAADHRASDGHEGGKLLAAIDRLLQAPEAL